MKKILTGRFISLGAILTTMTVLFQSAPVFIPVLGMVLSPFSTLPITIAALMSIPLGISVYIASALLLIFICFEESIILLFTTGLLGLVMGGLIHRMHILISILCSSLSLFLGIIILTYMVALPAFDNFAGLISPYFICFIFLSFSLVYGGVWNISCKKLAPCLLKWVGKEE